MKCTNLTLQQSEQLTLVTGLVEKGILGYEGIPPKQMQTFRKDGQKINIKAVFILAYI